MKNKSTLDTSDNRKKILQIAIDANIICKIEFLSQLAWCARRFHIPLKSMYLSSY